MSRSTFSVLFYVNRGKEKEGIVPIMGRITINGTQCQFSCKHSIPLATWDVNGRSNLFRFAPAKNCAKGRSKEALQINRDLDRSATKEGHREYGCPHARQEYQGTDHQALSASV